nr:hypothetical protein Itr_chr01CG13490 [Ipomoea trifida]
MLTNASPASNGRFPVRSLTTFLLKSWVVHGPAATSPSGGKSPSRTTTSSLIGKGRAAGIRPLPPLVSTSMISRGVAPSSDRILVPVKIWAAIFCRKIRLRAGSRPWKLLWVFSKDDDEIIAGDGE